MANTVFYSLDGSTTKLTNSLIRTYPRTGFIRWRTADVDARTADFADRSPIFAGITRKPRTEIFDHEVVEGAVRETARQYAKSLYSQRNAAAQTLVVTDNGVQKRLLVRPIRMLPHDSNNRQLVAQGEWLILSTYYLADTASSLATAAKSASPATMSVTNAGTEASPSATYTLQPTTAKGAGSGQRYLKYVTVVNSAPRDLINHPIEITGSWDHAAEVTATRSQADGDDVEVYSYPGNVRLMRYAAAGTGAFNQATTKIWIAADLPALREWADNGNATIGVSDTTFYTSTPLTNVEAVPFYAALEDEVVRVTAYNERAGTVTVVRGTRGSTAATHASGTPLRLATCFTILYGGTSIATPRYISNDYKPIPADSQASTNSAWTFASYCEPYDADDVHTLKPRPGSWVLARRPNAPPSGDWTGREDIYGMWVGHTASLTTDATPGTVLGISYRAAGGYDGHDLVDRWELYLGVGLSGVAFTQSTLTLEMSVPYEGKLVLFGYGRSGSETKVAEYYDSGTSPTPAFTTPVIALAFAIHPFDPKDPVDNPTFSSIIAANLPPDGQGFTVAAGLVATFDSVERLKVVLSARTDAYQIGRPDVGATLANADGETMTVRGLVMALSDTLTINVEARTATLGDGLSVAHMLDGEWPTIPADPAAAPYTSDITYTETGIGTVTMGITSYRSAWV